MNAAVSTYRTTASARRGRGFFKAGGSGAILTLVLGMMLLAARVSAYVIWVPAAVWPCGDPIHMVLQLGRSAYTLSDGSTSWDQCAEAMMQEWNLHLGTVQFEWERRSSAKAGLDGWNQIYWQSNTNDPSLGDALAVTLRWRNGSQAAETDIMVNVDYMWDAYSDRSYNHRSCNFPRECVQYYDLRRVLLHELGHVLGLDHPNYSGQIVVSVMNSGYSDINYLTSDDLAGVTFLYDTDRTKPVVTVTSPKEGERVTQPSAVIRGTVTDNCRVSHLTGQLNKNPARLADYWAESNQWYFPVSLQPGTNTIKMIGNDISGNQSAPVTRRVFYALPASVRVETHGLYPPTNRVELRPFDANRNYTLSAKAYAGYTFLGWTDGSGNLLTNGLNLMVCAQPGLVFQAHYRDVARPTVSSILPAQGRVFAPELKLSGKAADNGQLQRVLWSAEGVPWATAEGGSNWQTMVALLPGTNRVRVCAEDAEGNRSLTNTLLYRYVVTSPLRVITNGLGTIQGIPKGLPEVGLGYSLKAVPAAGQVFSNWTGGCASTNPTLKFLMSSNLELRANFVPNPFIPVKRQYYGLGYPGEAIPFSNCFSLTFTLADRGTFSGKLLTAGKAYPFAGAFDLQGKSRFSIPRGRSAPLAADWTLLPGEPVIEGTITDAAWSAAIVAERMNGKGRAGTYIFAAIPGENAPLPPGSGCGSLTVLATGAATLRGTLADGTPISVSGGVSEQGNLPSIILAYGSMGGIFSGYFGLPLQLNTTTPAAWYKPSRLADLRYREGFWGQCSIAMLAHSIPPSGQNPTVWTNGLLRLGEGGLPSEMVARIAWVRGVLKILESPLAGLKVTWNRTTSALTGGFTHPVTHAAVAFQGVLVRPNAAGDTNAPAFGVGWFLGATNAGYVRLEGE